MKLCDITLSYPFIRYQIDVTHFTSRYSTAIEWLILESIQKTHESPEYLGMTIEDFFYRLFGIKDTNLMIRPCLLDLRDMGAIQTDAIYDQTDMAQAQMSQLHLTQDGAQMQRDGKLPGMASTDGIKCYYDITDSKLFITDKDSANVSDKCRGVPIMEINDASEVIFPKVQVTDGLETLKKQKKKPWLTADTVIQSVVPSSSKLLWRNVFRNFNVGAGMQCSAEGIEDSDINAAALDFVNLHIPDASLPEIFTNNPDDDFDVLEPSDRIQTLIGQMNNKGNLFIADAHIGSDSLFGSNSGKQAVKLCIICNAEKTSVKIDRGVITVFVTESLLPEGYVYLDRTRAVGRGAFSLSAGNTVRYAELAYIPKKTEADAEKIALMCVQNHFRDFPSMLHILRILGEKTDFIKQYVNGLSSIEEKINCLVQLNEESMTLFKSKCVSDDRINELIFEAENIVPKVTDVSGAQRVLERYTSIEVLRNRSGAVESLLKMVIKNIGESHHLSDVHKFLDYINSIGKRYIKFINQEGLYKYLYSDDVLSELISKFQDEDIYEIEPYTKQESIIRDMRHHAEYTQDIPEISFFEPISEARLTEAVVNHRDELERIINALEFWRNLLTSFESNIGEFETKADVCPTLIQVNTNFKTLSAVLSMFCCDKSIRYGKICILDTNALMSMPELLSIFDGKNTMVVIPQMLLTELDGLKKSDDDEKAYQAREAIRMIDNYSAYDWVNLKEQSNVELLSDDLDPENPDSRIISVALKYIIHKPILVTDDINMRNIAKSQGITTMTPEGIASNIQQSEREQENVKKKDKKKKKRK